MPRVSTGAPFEERGGRLRGAFDLVAGRYPRFVFGGPVGPVLPVFHFHEATRETIEPAFRYLTENGYRTVVSDEVAAVVRDGASPPPRAVMLAFDDAWASLWLVVAPLLRQFGLRAVTYAIPARIAEAASVRPTIENGAVDAPAADRAPNPFVTWPELRSLAASGWVDVQSHTWSHTMMFTGDTVIGHVGPAFARESMLNRPRLGETVPLEFLAPDRTGFPLFQRRSRMSDARRFLPTAEACAALEAGSSRHADGPPFAGRIKGRWETDEERARAVEHELAASRDELEGRLGTAVRHICLPWGVSGKLTRAALERTGFETAFANQVRGRFAVSGRDDPYFLKRLSGRHLFSLPGTGRRTFTLFR